MSTPFAKDRIMRLVAPLVGLLLASALVVQASDAVFSDTTDNSGNTLGAGTVVLTDNDGGSAMFNVSTMVPTDTQSACIEVSYDGTSFDLSALKMYTSFTDTASFAQYLNLTIDQGLAGEDCTTITGTEVFNGTLAGLKTSHPDYANGLGLFTPASGDTMRPYKFTFTLDASTPNSAQGASVSPTFTWEVHSA